MKISIEDIRKARELLKGVIRPTQIDHSLSASKVMGTEVYYKLENEQLTGSFKIRGAYNKISHLTDAEKKRGVVASSAGNHAQGVALSAAKAGVKATIVMPKAAPLVKVSATRDYGAEVILHGESYDEAFEKAKELEKEKGLIFVHAFEDPLVIAGQGTIGLEIHEAIPDLESIIIPIGGGGLVSGVATVIRALNPKCRIIGVQSDQASGMQSLFQKTEVHQRTRVTTIADGIAVKKPSQVICDTYISKLVDEIVLVSDEELAEAIVFLLERAKTVVEGSGAAGVAAMLKRKLNLGKKTCVVLSGGNIDLNIISKVIEKGLLQKGRLVEIAVVVDDLPGRLSRMTSAIADMGANILEVHHDRMLLNLSLRETRINFLLETTGLEHADKIREALRGTGARIINS